MKKISLLLILLFSFSVTVQAETIESTPYRASFIELFTSEGCSSCPPAERWLNQFKEHPGLWKSFVPIAFHVDYWDYLGWKDPYATRDGTTRQHRYAKTWGSNQVYTPGVVLNGKEWRNWASSTRLPGRSLEEVGNLVITPLKENYFSLKFYPSKKSDLSYKGHAVLLGFDVSSQVKAGENRGRRLDHDFVVLNYKQDYLEFDKEGQFFEKMFKLKKKSSVKAVRYGIAAWVTDGNDPKAIQVTGGYLYTLGN